MKQKITYEKTVITVEYPVPIRKGQCDACLRKVGHGEINTTQKHHTVYKYEIVTVKKNPLLALENTLELCFGDHPIADGFRDILLSNPRGSLRNLARIFQVAKLLPKEQQVHLTRFCEMFLQYWKSKGDKM